MSGGGNRPRQPLVGDLSLDDFLPYLLNRISNRLNIDLAEDLREAGVTPQYWRVLATLHVAGGRSIGELSVYTITEQSTLSRTVDRMAQAGLVERRAPPEDARVAKVYLTAAGRETSDRILPVAIGQRVDHDRLGGVVSGRMAGAVGRDGAVAGVVIGLVGQVFVAMEHAEDHGAFPNLREIPQLAQHVERRQVGGASAQDVRVYLRVCAVVRLRLGGLVRNRLHE